MVRRNQSIDDDNLSELSSLTHLLDRNDNDDNEETPVLQHSPYYSDNQFIDIISKDNGLSILDMNICIGLYISCLPHVSKQSDHC